VRTRLVVLLVLLMGGFLAALSVPFAQNLAAQHAQRMFVDRLNDTSLFASTAQQLGADEADTQALHEALTRYGEVYGITAAVLNRSGAPLAASSDRLDLSVPAVAHAVRLARAGHQSDEPAPIWPWNDQPMAVAVPVMRGDDMIGVALTVSSTARLRGSVRFELATLAVGEVLALILLVMVASRLAAWVLRPVYVLDAAARHLGTGKLSTRVSATQGPEELRRLATTFNGMAQAVEDAMRRQHDFVADASHQLRNPLTALMLRLEGLGVGLDDDRREEFASVQEEAARLRLILDELLDLATAERVRAHPIVVDLEELVTARVDAWRALANRRGVSLRHPAASDVRVRTDPALAGTALDAVLDNAVKFSPAGGVVAVEVVAEPESVRIDVVDEGPGLCDEELTRVGDRFWRSPSSTNVPGFGLGLSIARTVLAATGGGLAFAAASPHGLRVSLLLPRATASPADGDAP
jgi:signal transduction histidine kinase